MATPATAQTDGSHVSRAPAASPRHGSLRAVAEDASTRAVFAQVEKVARGRIAVLILGETGTGKEVVASRLHEVSGRTGPFVALNAAALSSTLVESELFGHRKGAFTGADRDRVGLVEASSGGTLFLDEIGDLPLPLQAKLLRVLQEREVVRVGETRPRSVDLRVVSATHRDLLRMSEEGTFRQDLYHRLASFPVTLAPLRERPKDLAALMDRDLAGFTVAPEARDLLISYPWPGNVRELLAALETSRMMAGESRRIGVPELPRLVQMRGGSTATLKDRRADTEKEIVLLALSAEGGNRTRAARRLGISRQALHKKLGKLGIG